MKQDSGHRQIELDLPTAESHSRLDGRLSEGPTGEDPDYLSSQLLTYLGNKRSLLDFIGQGVALVQEALGRERFDCLDVFSGSGVVARYLRAWADRLYVNDLEYYSEVLNSCYLANTGELDLEHLAGVYRDLKAGLQEGALKPGIISRHYAPADDSRIQPGERVFYTSRNARYLDTARQLIAALAPEDRCFFLAPLLVCASVHANTSGVFKGYYKCTKSGLGQFGGTGRNALPRITADIQLPFPVFSRFECRTGIFRQDANVLARDLPPVDLAYIDPPYNQHPYGSNYFMLNLLAEYREPVDPSRVSGIPADWNRSSYNSARRAEETFLDLVRYLKARFLLISFNSEGFISLERMSCILEPFGRLKVLDIRYPTFRGSRNLAARSSHVNEYLYVLEKSCEY